MMRRLTFTFALLALITAGSAVAQEAVTFEMLTPPVAGTWAAASLSADGSRIAGNFGGDIWYFEDGAWTHVGAGHPLSSAVGISADGSAIVSASDDVDGIRHPTIWSESAGWAPMLLDGIPGGTPCDNSLGTGYSLNADGTMAVGLAWEDCHGTAFMWTPAGGTENIGPVRASMVSDDGSIIVGFIHHPSYGYRQPAYWQVTDGVANGPIAIGAADALGEAYAVNSDGSLMVGQYNDGTQANGLASIFYPDGTIEQLGTVEDNAAHTSLALGISDDLKIVGVSGEGGPWGFMRAYIYLPGQEMTYMEDFLAANDVAVPAGTYLTGVLDISTDGSYVIGTWIDDFWNQGLFLIRFSGVVAIDDEDPQDSSDLVPSSFSLAQNFPNPFNPQTNIAFALPSTEAVRLDVLDMRGRLVRTLVDDTMVAGEHTVVWSGRDQSGANVPSGTYVYRLQSESVMRMRTMTLLK